MNFQHTEDRRMLADTLERFISDQMGFEARMATVKQAQGFDRRAWQGLCDVGATGALFTEADGGLGGQGFDIAVVFEAIGHGLALTPALPVLLAGSAGAGLAETLAETDVLIVVPHERPSRVLEAQLVALHALCDAVDVQLMGDQE